MKKLLLGLGSIAAVVVPVVSVVSCGTNDKKEIKVDFSNVKTMADITALMQSVKKQADALDKNLDSGKGAKQIRIHLIDNGIELNEIIGEGVHRDEYTDKYKEFITKVFSNHHLAMSDTMF